MRNKIIVGDTVFDLRVHKFVNADNISVWISIHKFCNFARVVKFMVSPEYNSNEIGFQNFVYKG